MKRLIVLVVALLASCSSSPDPSVGDPGAGSLRVPGRHTSQAVDRLVVLGLGQSNFEGPIGEVLLENATRIRGFDLDGRWITAPTSLNNGAPYLVPILPVYSRGGPHQCLALYIADALVRDVDVIAAAKGGTSASQWSPSNKPATLYGAALQVVREAGASIDAIVIYQGEKNAQSVAEAKAWFPLWLETADALKRDYGDPLLVFVVPPETNPNPTVYPGWSVMLESVRAIASERRIVVESPDGDDIHLDEPRMRELGRRVADKITLP